MRHRLGPAGRDRSGRVQPRPLRRCLGERPRACRCRASSGPGSTAAWRGRRSSGTPTAAPSTVTPTYDRAVGPMQFLPGTWGRWGSDGDRDGVSDPQDVDDAALAAARYLCERTLRPGPPGAAARPSAATTTPSPTSTSCSRPLPGTGPEPAPGSAAEARRARPRRGPPTRSATSGPSRRSTPRRGPRPAGRSRPARSWVVVAPSAVVRARWRPHRPATRRRARRAAPFPRPLRPADRRAACPRRPFPRAACP